MCIRDSRYHSEHFKNAKPYEKCGAIYGHLGANKDKVVKKPGEWNHMHIKCEGQHITVTLNGQTVTEMDMSKWTSGTTNPDGTKFQVGCLNHSPNYRQKDLSVCRENMGTP